MQPAKFDDCINMLHLQRLWLVRIVRRLTACAWSNMHEEASHIVVKCLRHVPMRIAGCETLTELIDVSEENSSLEILRHGDCEHYLRCQSIGNYPAATCPCTMDGALSFFGDIEM